MRADIRVPSIANLGISIRKRVQVEARIFDWQESPAGMKNSQKGTKPISIRVMVPFIRVVNAEIHQ